MRLSWFRPTGYDLNAYTGHEHWSGERWAWEFLRRDDRFQRWYDDAETVNLSPSKLNSLARHKFGLMYFKPYPEDYDVGRMPRFASSGIQSWSRVTNKQAERLSRTRKMFLRRGEVLIKFDVKGTHKSQRNIEAQLDAARMVLESRAGQWRRRKGKKGEIWPKRRNMLLALLRLLDALAYEKWLKEEGWPLDEICSSRAELYRLLFEGKNVKAESFAQGEATVFGRKLQDKKEIATRFAATDYHILSAQDFTSKQGKRPIDHVIHGADGGTLAG